MRILLLNTDYDGFVRALYEKRPGLENASYAEQARARDESLFGTADFYSKNLRAAGHEAWDVHANIGPMQRAWAREHGVKLPAEREWRFRLRKKCVPWFDRAPSARWQLEAVRRQVEWYRPDVIYNLAMDGVSAAFLKTLGVPLLAGQIAAPLPPDEDFGAYGLIVSSLPNFVDRFRALGIDSEYLAFAFEPRASAARPAAERDVAVSFVGSFFDAHADRVRTIERLCERLPVEVWGHGLENLAAGSPVHKRYRGTAWGAQMYGVLGRSKITFNGHIGIAGEYANNMRLFEATGSGAMLVTDRKKNLKDLFEPGREVAAYGDADECERLVRHYLDNESEREAVAAAGLRRTLAEHGYAKRMRELADILSRRLKEKKA
jgi:hypothetical protein